MDGQRFDELARFLAEPASRRATLRSLGGGFIGGAFALLGGHGPQHAEAHNALAKCKKIKNKRRKKACIKKARQHDVDHGLQEPGEPCGATTCSSGKKCCPDQKCGVRCCANGYHCDQLCSGPNGDDYCCPPERPVAICGGCWTQGSTQCDTPEHCCSPNQVCCGDDHCCDIETQECRVNCGGVQGSNSCCGIGSVLCCQGGTAG
jgi:hypothetical protein